MTDAKTPALRNNAQPPTDACNGKKKRSEGLCRRPAGWGTSHPGYGRCKLHGGASPNGTTSAERQRLADHARKLGMPKDVDVETAMLDLIREAAGNVDFYRSLIQQLEQGDRLVTPTEDQDEETDEAPRVPSIAGRIKVDTLEAKPHVLVSMYNEERDRLQKYLKDAASLGIQARKLQQAEEHGRRIVAVLRGVLGDMGLLGDPRLPGLVRKHLEAIAATAVEAV